MKRPLPLSFSRNMTVIRSGTSLTLVGSLRLNEDGLAALDRLGKVEHVIRVAAYHGMDDAFYRDRYGARVWAMEGSFYSRGFEPGATPDRAYMQPDEWMAEGRDLPVEGARLHALPTQTQTEGLLLLEREGGIVVSGDCLQNWQRADEFFSWPARLVMGAMGFVKPYNIGPGWLKGAKPDTRAIRAILDLSFEHVLPVHGAEVIGGAREKYRPVIEAVR
jgi:hypothetical protein